MYVYLWGKYLNIHVYNIYIYRCVCNGICDGIYNGDGDGFPVVPSPANLIGYRYIYNIHIDVEWICIMSRIYSFKSSIPIFHIASPSNECVYIYICLMVCIQCEIYYIHITWLNLPFTVRNIIACIYIYTLNGV